MSWMQRLYESYVVIDELDGDKKLWPISHMLKLAHIEVVLDTNGCFKRFKLLDANIGATIIPASEYSSSRTGKKNAPHPLSDEISYCAGDYPEVEEKKFIAYCNQLIQWAECEFTHPKVQAVKNYILKKTLWHDLNRTENIFPLAYKKTTQGKTETTKILANKAFIRWVIEEPGNPIAGTWQDFDLIQKWIDFDQQYNSKKGFCFVGGDVTRVAESHARFLRHAGDGAKIVSSNDDKGFTFRGKFLNENQAYGLGFDVTQKAHNALRWLISRQGIRNGDQVIVAWAISGKAIPNPLTDAAVIALESEEDDYSRQEPKAELNDIEPAALDLSTDLGHRVAKNFKLKLKGYQQNLNDTEQLSLMVVDSATPGRMGVAYYREFLPKEYFEHLEAWHTQFAWWQRITQELPPEGVKKAKSTTIWPAIAPAPYAIAQTAYGVTLTDTLKKQVYSRLLPCIAEGRAFPRDLVQLCVNRASNPLGGEPWEWERNIGVACALYKGFFARHPDLNLRKVYSMKVDENKGRDYYFGCLLAIAEKVESLALTVQEKNRPTTAMRLMQRFSSQPMSTWKNIEEALHPYFMRIQNKYPPLFSAYKDLIDQMMFRLNDSDGFKNEPPLQGEYLLGYHLQRLWFKTYKYKEGVWILKSPDDKTEAFSEGQ
jgi:CRISPR-associated protein Csd1